MKKFYNLGQGLLLLTPTIINLDHAWIQKISSRSVWGVIINLFHRGLYRPPSVGLIASRGVSVLEFLRNPIATCDFPGVGPDSLPPPPLDLPMWIYLV